ncbi:MAG: hypothetical protein AAF611_03600 [Bacteroidota bacterium]
MTKITFQKILKVLLIAYTILVSGILLVLFVRSFSESDSVSVLEYVLVTIALVAGVFAGLFHIKTCPYYNKITHKRNILKVFWIGALILPIYILYSTHEVVLRFFTEFDFIIAAGAQGLGIFVIIAVLSLISIAETLFMTKRI